MSWIELVARKRPPQVPQGVTPPENAADWYRIENNADGDMDETDVYVYDAIGGWFGTTADGFIDDLKAVTSSRINLRLNSPGGSVFEGIAIANAIRTHPANVTVYVDGLAASIASVIALAGDRLVMMPQSQMMIHDASGAAYGNAEDMAYMVNLLNKQSDNIADAYADRAGGKASEWRDRMKAETWYSAKEAVKAGLADEVMPTPKKKTDESTDARMQSVWDLTAYRFAGRDAAPAPTGIVNIVPAPPVKEAVVDLTFTNAKIGDLIRDTVRAELEAFKAALPPFLKPDEDEKETEDSSEETEDSGGEEDVEDASKKKGKLPAFLQPKKDDDEDEDEEGDDEDEKSPAKTKDASDPESVEDGTDENQPDNAADLVETHDDAAFAGLVAQLTSPSPSADDIFNRLKEAL